MHEDRHPHDAGLTGPPPGTPIRNITFRLQDLPRVRELAESEARGAGMPEEAVGDFVIAVNEVATNAVTHGHVEARARMWADGDDVLVEVHDRGAWKPGPMPGSVGGMGLWVARMLSSDLDLRVGAGGSTVIMRFPAK
ncbi:ATP-binding protein [Nonomuraea sp. NPDC005501]|uniref:ATP-binding protein n=1 Tax=Nonomuraea sp. NPDC005501 TaxID=3156884 RepID=UPI0033B68D2B